MTKARFLKFSLLMAVFTSGLYLNSAMSSEADTSSGPTIMMIVLAPSPNLKTGVFCVGVPKAGSSCSSLSFESGEVSCNMKETTAFHAPSGSKLCFLLSAKNTPAFTNPPIIDSSCKDIGTLQEVITNSEGESTLFFLGTVPNKNAKQVYVSTFNLSIDPSTNQLLVLCRST